MELTSEAVSYTHLSLKILEWVALLSPFLGRGLVLFACFFDMDN